MHRYHKILREASEEFDKQWESWSEEQRAAYRQFLIDKQKEMEDQWLGMLMPTNQDTKVLTPDIWEKWFEKEIPVQ